MRPRCTPVLTHDLLPVLIPLPHPYRRADTAATLAMQVCVNPGNGAGGFFASDVLRPLGADISPSINLEPDGTFPAHMPNPEDQAHVAATLHAVSASGAQVCAHLDPRCPPRRCPPRRDDLCPLSHRLEECA